MDPQEQGVGDSHAPTDQDQNESSLQRQQAQQQPQQQTQQVHVQQQQQQQQQRVQQQQQLSDRQQSYQEQRRLLQLQQHHQYARAAQSHHPDVQQYQSNVMMQRMPHPQQHQPPPQQQTAPSHHVVAQQPHPGMTRSASNIVPSVAATAPSQSSSTSKLWEHFVKGEKMQKTNKFFANCIYCRKINRESRTRGERRMMSAHLSSCGQAPEDARQEGINISRELKMRRSLTTQGKKSKSTLISGSHGGVAVTPVGKRPRQRPSSIHPIAGPSGVHVAQDAIVAAAAAAAAAVHTPAEPGGTGGPPFFDPSLGHSISLSGEISRNASMNTNDNVRLYYEEAGNGHPLILIHDFAASCKYFDANFREFAQSFRVIRYDQRGHGDSEKPQYGFHVARLAADLRDVIDHFSLDRVALLGAGLGCSVMWAFVELFGQSQISALLFVDQSPYPMAAHDGSWVLGSKRVFSEGTLAYMNAELKNNARGFHESNLLAGFSRPLNNLETSMYVNESLKAAGPFLAKLMFDYYHADWRMNLSFVTCPALVIAGKKSKLYPWEGMAYAAESMPHAKLLPFEDGSHYLYIEEAYRFNNTVIAFLQSIVSGP